MKICFSFSFLYQHIVNINIHVNFNMIQARVGSHRVQGPIHVSKSQHGGKNPTSESQKTIKICLLIIKYGS